ncbi:MAG: sulfite exporter TauE/SafE family protein, partial [Candidatus Cloacimonetes bacterium]|nr:sulfite exporter TauE/SafE family protein [Candidatus Cloacimonadota bacterium]
EIFILAFSAATIGFIHTILGPDHYLPFIVMSKSRGWNLSKTAIITILCGIGHVLSSVILGFIGLGFGIAVFKLEIFESFRGGLAGWLLIVFGFTYFVWGIHKAIRSKNHTHLHHHKDGTTHNHEHKHLSEHSHLHAKSGKNLTPWILFTIFIFGPCEPLIPLIMYPAAKFNLSAVFVVAIIFGLTTISTMLIVVLSSCFGLSKLPIQKFEKYSHALAGFVVFVCGVAINFLGL